MDHPSPFSTPTLSSRSSAQSTEPSTPRSEYDFPNEFFGDYVPSDQADNYILVTGGLGYIGSHTTLELLKAGNNVVVIDDLSNSHYNVLTRIKALVNQHYSKVDTKCPPVLDFHQIDYRNTTDLRAVLDRYVLQPWKLPHRMNGVNQSKISGVIHFAAYKAVSESIRLPLNYYSNNVAGFVGLLETLNHYGIKNLVFSSSATVYGALDQKDGASIPEELCVHTEETYLRDTEPVLAQQGCRGLTNPYGRTKWMCEAILSDLCVSDPEWRVVALRYFNPVGCDPSGLLGEDPLGIPNNLMPIVCKVLRREIPALNVFGSDYKTTDGTGVRDFIHVCDLAKGSPERPFERRSLVLRQCFLRDEESRDFTFGHFDVRKAGDRLGVIKTEAQRIIFDRQSQAVSHEIDVPLNRLGRDFELLSNLSAIRKMPVLQPGMDRFNTITGKRVRIIVDDDDG